MTIRYESRQVSLATGETLYVFKWDTQRKLFKFMSDNSNVVGTVLVGVRLADNAIVQYRGKRAESFVALMHTTQVFARILSAPRGWAVAQ